MSARKRAAPAPGDDIVAAWKRRADKAAGYPGWAEYARAELHVPGYRPDTGTRIRTVTALRAAGMEFADIAVTVQASVRQVKNDADRAGMTRRRERAVAE